ncbi:MAG: amino acid adenylation domain-containing protein, partial [Chloroflexi bacterium]|nr:amino acid adenylation domain-containing protein [Chloroflexota bacterium]
MSTTKQLLQQLQDKNIKLSVREGNLHLDAPTGAMTLALRAQLKTHEVELLDLLQRENGRSHTLPTPDRTQHHLASVVQQRLWFLDQLDPGTPVYNITTAYRFKGALDVGAFAASINAIIARHEALRTTFHIENDSPMQVVAPEMTLPLPIVDLVQLPQSEQEMAVNSRFQQMVNHRFNLADGPLIQTALLKCADDEHVWIWTTHHIISDAWSMRIFNQELSTFYAAQVVEIEPQLPALPFQYLDYAAWQHAQLADGKLAETEAYWQAQLADVPPLLELPTDRIRPSQQQYHGDIVRMNVPPVLKDGLTRLSRSHNSTLFMTMLSAFKLLLYRLSGQEDIIVGTPIAGRNRVELEQMIGFFINTLALRTQVSTEMPFSELLTAVRTTTLNAYSHQNLPFEQVLKSLKADRNLSHTPLFQVMFNMFMLDDAGPQLPGLTSEPINTEDVHSKFDLTLYVREKNGKMQLRLVYNPALFDRTRMEEMLRQYQSLLQQIVEAPELSINAYSLVTKTAVPHLPDPTAPLSAQWRGAVHDQFSQLAALYPERFAIIDEKSQWTYEHLEQRSNQLAHYLRANRIETGDVVAVYGHRSASLVWALLGIMKAGAAFTILDPAYPLARLTHFIENTKPKGLVQLVAADKMLPSLEAMMDAPHFSCWVVLPDRNTAVAQRHLHDYANTPPAVKIGPNDLSHIAFTSGSTGLPKGVMGRHGSLSHFLPWQVEKLGLTADDRFSMLSGLSHDPLQRDIFTALWVGGTLCIPSQQIIGTPGALAEWMAAQQISFAHMTPPMAQMLTETATSTSSGQAVTSIPSLRGTFFVGDKLTQQDVRRLQQIAPNVTCINSYGATETQRAVSYDLIPPDGSNVWDKAVYPLGHGMPDAQLLVMNNSRALAGIGEVGEIYMRSPHLALGYLRDAQLTQARFVQNPFTDTKGDLLYRTGDLGRYLPDGRVEFAGRADRQIKIRGFRIEPGEIEVALSQHEVVQEAIVLLRQSERGQPRLLAYLVAPVSNRPDTQTLRAFLKQRVPDYMIPTAFMWLDSVPLTPNGKVSYGALPQPP